MDDLKAILDAAAKEVTVDCWADIQPLREAFCRTSLSSGPSTHRLERMAPDLAAEVVRLRAENEGAYARGFHDAQEKAKVEGRLTIIDSPKLAQMRAILKDCDGALKALGIPEDAEPRASARAALEGRDKRTAAPSSPAC